MVETPISIINRLLRVNAENTALFRKARGVRYILALRKDVCKRSIWVVSRNGKVS